MRVLTRGALAAMAVFAMWAVAADKPNSWLLPLMYLTVWMGVALLTDEEEFSE